MNRTTHTIRRRTLRALLAALCIAPLGMQGAARDAPLKIGFLVKMPEQAWFINEQNAASALGQKENFSVVKIARPTARRCWPRSTTSARRARRAS